jgi:glycosyltransferase involved in cell wall biosynthesis
LNIWIVSAYDPLPTLDTDIRLLRYGSIALALVQAGHQVVFWTSTFAHWRKLHRATGHARREISPGLTAELLHARGYHSNVSLARIIHNRQLARAFKQRAPGYPERPDVILAEIPCLELAEAAADFARRERIPFICDIQDIWPDVYLTCLPRWMHFPARALLGREYRRLRRILGAADSVTAVSQAYLDWTRPWMARPLRQNDAVFPLGYTLPTSAMRAEATARQTGFLTAHGLRGNELLVVFLGQFATSYDVETIVEAARILEFDSALPPFRVVLAGNGDKEARLRLLADDLRSVVFTGWLQHSDTICLLETAHVALAAYAPGAAQSLPYKPFEYMAFGLPIVNSLPGELREIVDRERLGANYDAGSPASLAAAVAALLRDPALRTGCAWRARSLYESQYNSSMIYTRMSDLIARLGRTVPAN